MAQMKKAKKSGKSRNHVGFSGNGAKKTVNEKLNDFAQITGLFALDLARFKL